MSFATADDLELVRSLDHFLGSSNTGTRVRRERVEEEELTEFQGFKQMFTLGCDAETLHAQSPPTRRQ